MIRNKINDEFKNEIKRDFVLLNMIIQPLILTIIIIINYNDPEFGFQGAQYGLGVVILILFPMIWVMIYLFTKYIALQRKELDRFEKPSNDDINKEVQKEYGGDKK